MALSRTIIDAAAMGVVTDCKMSTFPFDPSVAANINGIAIEGRADMPTVSGAIFLSDDTVIFHPEDMTGGLLNFTIGHELGHYFLSGHTDQILSEGGKHFSREATLSNKKPLIEQEADYFSACFLMPKQVTKQLLASKPVGLEGILSLRKAAKTSITSSTIRTIECDPYPIAMVMLDKHCKISYSRRSTSFSNAIPSKQLSYGDEIPSNSAAFKMAQDVYTNSGEREFEQSNSSAWFGSGNRLLEVETYHLGSHGTLVVFTGEAHWEEEDEESELIKSWVPKFKY